MPLVSTKNDTFSIFIPIFFVFTEHIFNNYNFNMSLLQL